MSKQIFKIKFKNQITRLDIFKNMLYKYNYNKILTNDGLKMNDKSYQGFVFETIPGNLIDLISIMFFELK